MKPIRIFTFPAHRTFERFTKYSNCKIDSHLPILEIPNQLGIGNILCFDILNDISIILFSGTFNKEIILELNSADSISTLQFIYNYKNPLNYKSAKDNTWNVIDQFQHAVTIESNKTLNQIKLLPNKSYYSYIICIAKINYLNNRNYCSKAVSDSLKTIFEERESNSRFFHKGSYNLEIADLLQKLNIKNFYSFEDQILLEAKIHQLIHQHFNQYKKDLEKEEIDINLSSYEVNAIYKATQYIEKNLQDIKSVSQVARYAGLNNNKLQLGFNELYDLSVNKYIRKARMVKARELLMNTDQSINQIVCSLGLQSDSYFSKLFKEQYKVSPSVFKIKNNSKIK